MKYVYVISIYSYIHFALNFVFPLNGWSLTLHVKKGKCFLSSSKMVQRYEGNISIKPEHIVFLKDFL